MWGRLSPDCVPRFSGCTAGPDFPLPAWLPGPELLWQTTALPSNVQSHRARRLSLTSDSGDTGIGTSCSDSVEDHSTSSGTSFFMPSRSPLSIPIVPVMPSTPSPTLSRYREGEKSEGPRWNPHQLPPGDSRSPRSIDSSLDLRDLRPMRKWSSLSKLSTTDACSLDERYEKGESRHSMEGLGRDVTGSKPSRGNGPVCLHPNMELLQVDSRELFRNQSSSLDCKYKLERCAKEEFGISSSSCRRRALDMTYSALPESKPAAMSPEIHGQRYALLGQQAMVGPLQPSVRTQMWLTEQLHTNSLDRRLSEEACNLVNCKQQQQLEQLVGMEHTQGGSGSARQARSPRGPPQDFSKWESLMKIKEGLLRQKEIVIDRQKQQIVHLHQKIRENDLRTQQAFLGHFVNCGDSHRNHEPQYESKLQTSLSDRSQLLQCEKEELEQKLASMEIEVSQLKDILKQSTKKSGEEIRKLEEKVKTRDKYINSLKKKYQKEFEQNREKKRRIETLEKYLADLPTLDDVKNQNERLQVLEEKNHQLQETITGLEKKLEETMVQSQERESQVESQKRREKELVTTVQSLQQKVERCLEDGIRLPMLDTKQLQSENDHLKEQNERASKVIDNQQKHIDRINVEIQATKEKLGLEKQAVQKMESELAEREQSLLKIQETLLENQRLREENICLKKQAQHKEQSNQPLLEKMPAAEQCLKEMSHCLFDLKALCCILNQRAQGKEPNFSLLLEMGSVNSCNEETENFHSSEALSKKLSDVRQLRKDIDELRTIISDCYAQDMGDNCVTQ
ncbi:centrosomal protein of 85 kDa-like isoform X2 [Microcaecilia unicolor]|uniref:Centrosomal protein of 85 kDa-like isoform X2 n=1 Tax=Microcaecilia unicolor TaxID=1415580 RepID=A0A6P7XUR7_9AMPH|nr:centrosomal protein of 85 kDa-like isoform X2 [Microcaecilia unicolor]